MTQSSIFNKQTCWFEVKTNWLNVKTNDTNILAFQIYNTIELIVLEDFFNLLSIAKYKCWCPLCEFPFSLDINPENLNIQNILDIISARASPDGCVPAGVLQVIYLVDLFFSLLSLFLGAKIYALKKRERGFIFCWPLSFGGKLGYFGPTISISDRPRIWSGRFKKA